MKHQLVPIALLGAVSIHEGCVELETEATPEGEGEVLIRSENFDPTDWTIISGTERQNEKGDFVLHSHEALALYGPPVEYSPDLFDGLEVGELTYQPSEPDRAYLIRVNERLEYTLGLDDDLGLHFGELRLRKSESGEVPGTDAQYLVSEIILIPDLEVAESERRFHFVTRIDGELKSATLIHKVLMADDPL